MSKKTILIAFVVSGISVVTLYPHVIYAATTANNFVPLTQFPAITDFNANTTNLTSFFNSLYKYAVGAAAILALLMIIVAGFTWMSAGDSAEKVSKAKKRIQDAIFGLVLVLSPTIVFGIINPNVLDLKLDFGKLAPVTTSTGTSATTATTGSTAATGSSCAYAGISISGGSCPTGQQTIPSSCCPATLAAGSICCGGSSTATGNESGVRSQLSAAGVSVQGSACATGQTTGCTDVGGLQAATVQQAVDIKSVCGSEVITGGNEAGHSTSGDLSHSNGYKIDISTAEDSCIESGTGGYFSPDGTRGGTGGGPQYKDKCGNTYVRESSPAHWDITVTQACPA